MPDTSPPQHTSSDRHILLRPYSSRRDIAETNLQRTKMGIETAEARRRDIKEHLEQLPAALPLPHITRGRTLTPVLLTAAATGIAARAAHEEVLPLDGTASEAGMTLALWTLAGGLLIALLAANSTTRPKGRLYLGVALTVPPAIAGCTIAAATTDAELGVVVALAVALVAWVWAGRLHRQQQSRITLDETLASLEAEIVALRQVLIDESASLQLASSRHDERLAELAHEQHGGEASALTRDRGSIPASS